MAERATCNGISMASITTTSTGANPPLRVYIVEDSIAVRDFIAKVVGEIHGIFLGGCSDTEDGAFDYLRRHGCDVLILDIQLKQGNGMNLLRALARENVRPDPLKIIFSNHVSGAYRRVGQQYGVRFFFDKASQFLELRALLEQLGSGAGIA